MTSPQQPQLPPENSEGMRMLPTVDPESAVGKSLNDSVARLRFANVDREVREMAQKVLDGKASARELMSLPEFQTLLEEGRKQLRADIEAMTDEERAAIFGTRLEEGARSPAAESGARAWDA